MEPIKEQTVLEGLVNKLEAAAGKILDNTDTIEAKLNWKCWADNELTKAWPSGLLNRLEIVVSTLEASGKNLTHIIDTLI